MGLWIPFLIAPRFNFAAEFGSVVAPRCGHFTSARRSKRPSIFKFCQNDKNLLWDELNIQKREYQVKGVSINETGDRHLMITDSNQVSSAKMSGCKLQEERSMKRDDRFHPQGWGIVVLRISPPFPFPSDGEGGE